MMGTNVPGGGGGNVGLEKGGIGAMVGTCGNDCTFTFAAANKQINNCNRNSYGFRNKLQLRTLSFFVKRIYCVLMAFTTQKLDLAIRLRVFISKTLCWRARLPGRFIFA